MKNRIRQQTLISVFAFGILFIAPLRAQETIPRNISPGELVSLDRSIPLKTALDILSQYSLKYEKKIIIDPQGRRGPINVMVNNMYWKRALEYILRSNLMKFQEHDKYYEVVPLVESKTTQSETGIDTGTREIEIKAIFFEADHQTLMEAGIDWSLVKNGKVRVNGNFGSEVTKDLFRAQVTETHGAWDVFALLRTFESLDKGEVIANPQIKVMDGEEGKIKVGTNFFLTTRDFAGNTRFTEYESGIILKVTPTVIGTPDSLFIHLQIRTERSTVIPDPTAVTKAITESNTEVLLLNGEETVIAGLYSNEVSTSRRGIPILKDLPPWFFGLRYLFGYESRKVAKKELVIVLEATVVPTIQERIARRLAGKKVSLEERRQEFERKLKQLKARRTRTQRSTGTRRRSQ